MRAYKFLSAFALFVVFSSATHPAFAQNYSEMNSALERIRLQSAARDAWIYGQNQIEQRDLQVSGQNAAEGYIREGRKLAEDMRNTVMSDGQGGVVPAYSSSDIARAQAVYQKNANTAISAAEQVAKVVNRNYAARAKGLQDSADALRDQLLQKPAPSDTIMLQPIGTNLYVRNYQLIGEQYNRMPHVQPMSAVQQRAGAPQAGVQHTVSGYLLPPRSAK